MCVCGVYLPTGLNHSTVEWATSYNFMLYSYHYDDFVPATAEWVISDQSDNLLAQNKSIKIFEQIWNTNVNL